MPRVWPSKISVATTTMKTLPAPFPANGPYLADRSELQSAATAHPATCSFAWTSMATSSTTHSHKADNVITFLPCDGRNLNSGYGFDDPAIQRACLTSSGVGHFRKLSPREGVK